MTSKVKQHNKGTNDGHQHQGASLWMPQKQHSSSRSVVSAPASAWQEDLVVYALEDFTGARPQSQSLPARRIVRRQSRVNRKYGSNSQHHHTRTKAACCDDGGRRERNASSRLLQKSNSSRSLPIVAWEEEHEDLTGEDSLDDCKSTASSSSSPERKITRRNSFVMLSSSFPDDDGTAEDRPKSKSCHERRTTKSRSKSWDMLSRSVHGMVDDLMKSLMEEESPPAVEEEGQQKRRNSIGSDVAARVSEIVEDKEEFRKLKAEMRATGMATGAGAMQHIVKLDEKEDRHHSS